MAAAVKVNGNGFADIHSTDGNTPKYLRNPDHVMSIEDALGNVGRHLSRLQRERLEYEPLVPNTLRGGVPGSHAIWQPTWPSRLGHALS